jgi:Fe2+ transport system protein FeoA
MRAKRNLGQMKVGQKCRVCDVSLPADYEQRLAELGVMPGAEVSLVQVAPLGDPIAIECQGRRMGMRRCDATGITVEGE